jgi:signal transduction histidine kinase
MATLIIEDTGVGILAEDIPHLFERFYRGNHRQPSDIPGTGLGLAIVKEIVEIHQGAISVNSETDRGTQFTIHLPATQSLEAGRVNLTHPPKQPHPVSL